MDQTLPKQMRELDPIHARFLRRIMSFFGGHRSCTYKACRRARACATRHALCYQAHEKEMRPIMLSIKAWMWSRDVAAGVAREIAPAYAADMTRLIAWEAEEIKRIEAGHYGGNDKLTHYQRWLKHSMAPALARAAQRGRAPAKEPAPRSAARRRRATA
jgi:hypothetical protein